MTAEPMPSATYAVIAALNEWRRSGESLDDTISAELAEAFDVAYDLGTDWALARYDEILDG